ncbi:MAG: acyltransferase [Candidatus Promineifilaceae bacterium]
MTAQDTNLHTKRPRPWQRLTLAEYVRRRNGVPLGDSRSLRNMLIRSFGAGSFGQFWQYWNPIFGYGLGKYVYSPLQRFLPPAVALVMTFIISGGIHDLVTMAIRRSTAFFFIPWFFLLGVGVVIGRGLNIDFSERPWLVRSAINLSYMLVCLAITLLARQQFGIS